MLFKKAKALLIFIFVLILTGCSSKNYSGTYGGTSDEGIFISMTLNDDKTAETNFFGIPMSGTYQIDGNKLELSFSDQVLRGC